MTTLPIPLTPEEFTPQWLTAAFAAGRAVNGATVTGVGAGALGEGFGLLGSLARLTLTYDRPAAGAPATVIAKFPALTEMNRDVARQYQVYVREARFYQEIANTVSAMPTPQIYYVAHDPETKDGVVLLEDLAGARRIGDQLGSPSPAEAAQLMDQIADLHATWWDRTDDGTLAWVPRFSDPLWDLVLESMRGFWPIYQEAYGHLLSPEMHAIVERVWQGLPWLLERLSRPPITFVHGDYRLDNMFFPQTAGDPVTSIDWQLTSHGRGPYDVGYFTSQSLPVEQRRETEEALLRRYHERLVAGGVRDYSFDDCFEDYRVAALWCVVYPIAMGGGMAGSAERGAQLATEVSRRSFATIRDLDAVSVLLS